MANNIFIMFCLQKKKKKKNNKNLKQQQFKLKWYEASQPKNMRSKT